MRRTLTALTTAVAALGLAATGITYAAAAPVAPATPVTGEAAVDLVNPFIGSEGDGNTFPGAVVPFGMAVPSPDTGHNTGYSYGDDHIRGFSMVHISGVGCGLGGDLPMLPTTGVPTSTDNAAYALPFSHDDEEASPGYYGVTLDAPGGDIRTELTATMRTGWQRYTFPATKDATVMINTGQALHAVTSSRATVVDDHTIATTVTGQGFCQSTQPYTLNFVTRFDKPFTSTGTWADDVLTAGSTQTTGPGRRGAWVGFDTTTDQQVTAVTSMSYVDASGARKNLAAEGKGTFDATHTAARTAWAGRLGTVETTGGAEADRRTVLLLALPQLHHAEHGQRRRPAVPRVRRPAAHRGRQRVLPELLVVGHLPHPGPAPRAARAEGGARPGGLAAARGRSRVDGRRAGSTATSRPTS